MSRRGTKQKKTCVVAGQALAAAQQKISTFHRNRPVPHSATPRRLSKSRLPDVAFPYVYQTAESAFFAAYPLDFSHSLCKVNFAYLSVFPGWNDIPPRAVSNAAGAFDVLHKISAKFSTPIRNAQNAFRHRFTFHRYYFAGIQFPSNPFILMHCVQGVAKSSRNSEQQVRNLFRERSAAAHRLCPLRERPVNAEHPKKGTRAFLFL